MPHPQNPITPLEASASEADSVAFDVQGELAAYEDELSRLEDYMAHRNTDDPAYPEWWYQGGVNRHALKNAISESFDPDIITRYVTSDLHRYELSRRENRQEGKSYAVSSLADAIGHDKLAIAFHHEGDDGLLHAQILKTLVDAPGSQEHIGQELNVLKAIYSLDSVTELVGLQGGEYEAAIRTTLLNENAFRWIRYTDQEKTESWKDTQEASRKWMTKALVAAIGLDEQEADNYVFAASKRANDDSKILAIINKFEVFGISRLKKITEFSGIYALADYTTEQLELMEKLADGDQTEVESLQHHDVIVTMINRMGDHNGVLTGVAEQFDDSHKRTLFFEIISMSDIYKKMLKLKDLGIKPSTLVLSAHSAPGQFMVSDDRDTKLKRRDIATVVGRQLVQMVNTDGSLDKGDFGYSLHGMKGFKRLVDDLMAPSQAIDDAVADEGRKKIIFQACYAGSEVKSADIDEISGEKIQLSMESVASQLGKDLLKQGVTSTVDIYGAADGIQMHGTAAGVRYTSQPLDWGSERPDFDATKISVQDGSLEKSSVGEIPLRNIAETTIPTQ